MTISFKSKIMEIIISFLEFAKELLELIRDKRQDKKQKEEEISQAKDKIDEACDSGSLSDLLDATKELGDKKRKRA